MTTHAVVLAYLFIHLGVILVATAYFTVGALLAPQFTARARDRFAARPWLPALIGLGISIPWVVAALVFLNMPAAPVKFAGAALLAIWTLVALLGGAGIAQHLGRPADGGALGWGASVRGGLFLSITWILPIVGWLLVLPLSMATGIGCVVLGALPARGTPAPATLQV